jgi:hypothetical protein
LLPQREVNPNFFLPPSPTCNQIWRSLVVNDGQPTYLTKLKKKLAIDHNLSDFFTPQILAIFFTNKIKKDLEFSSLFSGVILTNISIFGKSCKMFYVRKVEKEKKKAQLGFYCVILPLGY